VAEYLEKALGSKVVLDDSGKPGEFTVWVNGKTVSKKGLIRFPSKETVLAAVRNEIEQHS